MQRTIFWSDWWMLEFRLTTWPEYIRGSLKDRVEACTRGGLLGRRKFWQLVFFAPGKRWALCLVQCLAVSLTLFVRYTSYQRGKAKDYKAWAGLWDSTTPRRACTPLEGQWVAQGRPRGKHHRLKPLTKMTTFYCHVASFILSEVLSMLSWGWRPAMISNIAMCSKWQNVDSSCESQQRWLIAWKNGAEMQWAWLRWSLFPRRVRKTSTNLMKSRRFTSFVTAESL